MNIPVYVVTGFLGSGKTQFITEMLTDDSFNEGERTLLLCCEEGEDEYTPEALKKGNATLLNLDDPKQIAGKRYAAEMRSRGIQTIVQYEVAFSGKSVEISRTETG